MKIRLKIPNKPLVDLYKQVNRNRDLSFGALGLMCFLGSRSQGIYITKENLIEFGKEANTEEETLRCIDELIEKGIAEFFDEVDNE